MSKKILITGASGLLGRECMATFSRDQEWSVLGLAYSRAGDKLKKVDLTNFQELTSAVKEFQPSVIIHAAAERRPDVVDKEEDRTKRLNVDATRKLCELANEVGACVVYISTDYVFDGTKPPYKPTDIPNPLNKYGISKAEGEKTVMDSSSGHIIFRVPILYGTVERLDESAVTVLFEKVKNPDLKGGFHWSGDEMMTKYDMAVAMAEEFGIITSHIIADNKRASGAPRPFDCRLDCSRLKELGAKNQVKFREGIKKALQKFYP